MLNVDLYFYETLKREAEVINLTEGRIFNPARPEIDDKEDLLPYVIIMYDNGNAQDDTKDEPFVELNSATVSVMCVAKKREELGNLTELINGTIASAINADAYYDEHDEWTFHIDSCTPSADRVQYDPTKPCYFQILTYQCETSKM